MTIDGQAVGLQVLEIARRGVAGPDQHEDALVFAGGDLDERHDAVRSQVGIDGHGIGMPGRLEGTTDRHLAKISAGVCLGRGADIVAFAVEDDDESVLLGILDGGMERGKPLGAKGFVKCRLEFDRGDQGATTSITSQPKVQSASLIPARSSGNLSMNPGGSSSGLGSIPTRTGFSF